MQQWDKFDACKQRNMSVLDYLHWLHEIADAIGDLGDKDIVLAFWQCCKAYLCFELSKEGFDPGHMSLAALKAAAIHYE